MITRDTTGDTTHIKCQSCNWIGSIGDTYSDYAYSGNDDNDSDEIYCDNICPKCHTWQDITDYVIIHE